jgi:flagellar basal-body rod protein FlgG
VDMIVGQRAYEANSKCIQTADNMLQMANNIKR